MKKGLFPISWRLECMGNFDLSIQRLHRRGSVSYSDALQVVSLLGEIVVSILEGERVPLSNDPHCDSRQQCVELGSEILSFLHAELAVSLIKQYLILLSSSALRYPFPGQFFPLSKPGPGHHERLSRNSLERIRSDPPREN
ncbi:Uncharacterized protein XB15_01995 [Leptospira santarosai]|nr:Uncharacterized protein XB15_01995 [Leptospira santarosai]